MKSYNYRILLRKEPEGGFTVTVPVLQGCISYGDTIDTAIENTKEAIELYIETLIEYNEEIPSEDGILEYNLSVNYNA
ncbi:MAG: type II toxin-antitoxin system HicB family antitoxin [Ignavibacteria bacterium]